MIVYAQCLLERGLVIPKHHIARRHRQVLGQFGLREENDVEMKRMTRIARLKVINTPETRATRPRDLGMDQLPPLVEATVLHWRDRRLTVTGFERIEVSAMQECSYRQTWLLRFPTEEELDDILRDGLPRNPGPLGFGVDPPKPVRE